MQGNQNPNRKIISRSGGFFEDFANRFRLIGRLIMDSRVTPLLKLLPIGTLIYVLSPIDLISLNPIDDAFIIWAGTSLFVEMCPPQIVEEHLQNMNRVIQGKWNEFTGQAAQDEIVDGEYTETDARGKGGTSSR